MTAPDESGGLDPRDAEHLRLLALFHRVLAGITFLFACFPLLHVAVGVGMLLMPSEAFHPEHGRERPVGPGGSVGHAGATEASAEHSSSDPIDLPVEAAEAARPSGDTPARGPETAHGQDEDGHEATGRPLAPFERAMPRLVGGMFLAIGGIMVLCGWTLAVLMAVAGLRLRQCRSRTFCLIVAGLECLFMPLGTVLGVFTIIVLIRPGVEAAFDRD